MAGATDLDDLLGSMSPELKPDLFVFARLPAGKQTPAAIEPLMVFRETEGRTLILRQDEAAAACIDSTFPCRMITLRIHSSLDAVGFLAAITTRLASVGISVNPVSAYFHDHLFVPQERAHEALEILEAMSAQGRDRLKTPT